MPRKLVAGNWKMNGLAESGSVIDAVAAAHPSPSCDLLICPPATLISRLAGRGVPVGGQDCHAAVSGAHTGDVSAEMLRDAGAEAVIVGHSERRADHGETDEIVAAKAKAAWRAGLLAIVCVGETEAERDAGGTLARIGRQLAGSRARRRDARAPRRRLRAGLGDRNRAHAEDGPDRRGSRLPARRTRGPLRRRGRRRRPPALRRLGQAFQRRRDLRRSRRRRRADRRGLARSGRLQRDRRCRVELIVSKRQYD